MIDIVDINQKIVSYFWQFMGTTFKEAEKWTFKSKIWEPKISFSVIKMP